MFEEAIDLVLRAMGSRNELSTILNTALMFVDKELSQFNKKTYNIWALVVWRVNLV